MKFTIDDKDYDIIIEKKNIKNTYIRVKDDLKIYITTNKYSTKSYILSLINNNSKSIIKMINSKEKHLINNSKFYYLGKEYKTVRLNDIKKVTIVEDYIYYKNEKDLDNFLARQAKEFLPNRLLLIHKYMDNRNIPIPNIKVRKMTRKWGYCNKRDNIVCLNKDLIKKDIDDIDYVIVHELCHYLHFDHSKAFWNEVKKYKSNYLVNKKHLKED